MRWILAVLSLLVCCQQSRAFSGIELYKICSGPYLERNQENICFGYIRGFSEGYYMGIAVGKMAEQKHGKPCYPQPPSDEPPDATQAELIVKKYMTDHPEELNKPAFFIVQNALSEAFGCRSK
jgi:hypothetical protein